MPTTPLRVRLRQLQITIRHRSSDSGPGGVADGYVGEPRPIPPIVRWSCWPSPPRRPHDWDAAMSARDITQPMLSTPRNPARTVPVGGLSVGLVIRALVQSRPESVT